MREALDHGDASQPLEVVEDGEQALLYLRKKGKYSQSPRPDLIFLDLNLPRRNGREVLAEVKADEELRRIPVIVLTTSEAESDVQTVYDLHANCYVKKPTDLDEFLKVIRACQHFWSGVVRLPR